MSGRDPAVAGAGLVAALVRAGQKRFRYRVTVHRLLGIRPREVQAIARPGGHGAPVRSGPRPGREDARSRRAPARDPAAAAAIEPAPAAFQRMEHPLEASSGPRAVEIALPRANAAPLPVRPHAEAAPEIAATPAATPAATRAVTPIADLDLTRLPRALASDAAGGIAPAPPGREARAPRPPR
jgi:hypothetical protein